MRKEAKHAPKEKAEEEEKPKKARPKIKPKVEPPSEDEPRLQSNEGGEDESLTKIGANLLSLLGDDDPIVFPDETDMSEPAACCG